MTRRRVTGIRPEVRFEIAEQDHYLLLVLVTSWFVAIPVHAADAASRIGLWKGENATFEMFKSEGKLSAKIVALSEPKTTERSAFIGIAVIGRNYIWT
jgi:hypothetical protein